MIGNDLETFHITPTSSNHWCSLSINSLDERANEKVGCVSLILTNFGLTERAI